MKFLSVLFLGGGLAMVEGSTFHAYTGTNYGGTRSSRSTVGSINGNFKSFKWTRTSDDLCFKLCRGNYEVGPGSRCMGGSSQDPDFSSGFTKVFIHKEGQNPYCG